MVPLLAEEHNKKASVAPRIPRNRVIFVDLCEVLVRFVGNSRGIPRCEEPTFLTKGTKTTTKVHKVR